MMTLQLPGFQSVRSETGVFGKRHVKVPFGAETAAETSAAGVEGGAAEITRTREQLLQP